MAGVAARDVLAAATDALRSGNLAAAEAALAPFFNGRQAATPDLLNIAGTLRMQQGRLAEAAGLFERAVKAAPADPVFAFNLGLAQSRLGRPQEAEAALRAALKHKPDLAPALFELGAVLHRAERFDEAEQTLHDLLRLQPGVLHVLLALAAVLMDAGRPSEAETLLREKLAAAPEPRVRAQLFLHLAQALRRQRKDEAALTALDSVEAIAPAAPGIARQRAETLRNLERFDEAVTALETEIARRPDDPVLHQDYNALLYQLGRSADLLSSYDRAPQSRELLLGKASFLAKQKRHAEAHAIYADLLTRDDNDRAAGTGAAQMLALMGNFAEASTQFDALLTRHGDDAGLFAGAAEPALLAGDPGKAAWLCEKGLAQAPLNASCIAMLSIASRMMEDGRDEAFNRYETLVRSFDLDPPPGFSGMEDFNAALNGELDRLHPGTREFIDQSLRGGTQTQGHLFPAGLPLVTLLKQRIDEAVARYIAELAEDEAHPLLSRRSNRFRYSGSWSSRLRDCGFHVNHFHPDGWISSCYYVAVPDAVRDGAKQEGWIKFGQPPLDVRLKTPIRRTIQPAPGRLVLFPSYTWHGTVPFHDRTARTTIAFDVVPTR